MEVSQKASQPEQTVKSSAISLIAVEQLDPNRIVVGVCLRISYYEMIFWESSLGELRWFLSGEFDAPYGPGVQPEAGADRNSA